MSSLTTAITLHLAATYTGSTDLSTLRDVLDLNRNITLITNVFLPWGDEPENGQFQSIYGASPASLFIQAAIYY